MKKLTVLILVFCLVFTLFSCNSRGDGEPSGTPADSDSSEQNPPRDSSDRDEELTLLTGEMGEPSVGHYEFERDGMLIGVDFWNVPHPWYGNRLEGTLTYTNNTGVEISRYIHAFVELGAPWDEDNEVYYASAPKVDPSEAFASVGKDAPLFLNLLPGKTITVNFSIEIPPDIKENDAFYNLFFGLYENEIPKDSEVEYLVSFVVHH